MVNKTFFSHNCTQWTALNYSKDSDMHTHELNPHVSKDLKGKIISFDIVNYFAKIFRTGTENIM